MATLDRRIVGNDTDAVEIKTTAKHVSRPRALLVVAGARRRCTAPTSSGSTSSCSTPRMSLATYVVERDDDGHRPTRRRRQRGDGATSHVGEWPPIGRRHDPPARHTDRVRRARRPTAAADLDGVARRHGRSCTSSRRVEAAHKAALVAVLGDAQAATVDGRPVLTYRSHTRSSIDLTRLRAEHADLAAELSTEQVVRVLRPTRTAVELVPPRPETITHKENPDAQRHDNDTVERLWPGAADPKDPRFVPLELRDVVADMPRRRRAEAAPRVVHDQGADPHRRPPRRSHTLNPSTDLDDLEIAWSWKKMRWARRQLVGQRADAEQNAYDAAQYRCPSAPRSARPALDRPPHPTPPARRRPRSQRLRQVRRRRRRLAVDRLAAEMIDGRTRGEAAAALLERSPP